MTTMTLSEAAAAYAAARCLAARVRDQRHRVTTDHPTRCGWCDYPTSVLDGMVRGFNAAVDFDGRNGTTVTDVAEFGRLGRDEQRRRISAAQSLEAVSFATDSVQELDRGPADAAAPPPPAWLGPADQLGGSR